MNDREICCSWLFFIVAKLKDRTSHVRVFWSCFI
nr:MAG TPA: hypothetical protein [Caudoviricetes sp.]